jgi:hypothetical protein
VPKRTTQSILFMQTIGLSNNTVRSEYQAQPILANTNGATRQRQEVYQAVEISS